MFYQAFMSILVLVYFDTRYISKYMRYHVGLFQPNIACQLSEFTDNMSKKSNLCVESRDFHLNLELCSLMVGALINS